MSQSGVFKLIVRDQRFDQLFTASDLLRKRLAQIRQSREEKDLENPQPTFVDVERSHILYLRAAYRPYVAVASEYVRVKPHGNPGTITENFGSIEFTFPIYGHFTSDMVFHIRFKDLGTANPGPAAPRYRFCAYPGMRVLRRVSFRSNETLVDDYTRDEVSFVNKFAVPTDRRVAWDRGMGQAELRSAEFYNNNGYTGVLNYKDGLQSLKFLHESQDLWVPLQFWMCQDASHALMNDMIPNTQRTVVVELGKLGEIIQAVDQNSGAVVPLPISRLGMEIDLYVNNLFVNPEIHDIYASRIALSLIRVHRRQSKVLDKSLDSVRLDQLKYPLEYMYFGIRDQDNAADLDHWHLFGRARTRTSASSLLAAAAIWNSALDMCQLVCRTAKETDTLDPIAQTVKITAHGVDLYPQLPASFFNAYLPQRYFSSTMVVAPQDTAAYMAAFCLYPGEFNPSGYYNLSSGRELDLSYRADSIDSSNTAELVVAASTLNFLVRKGDSVQLRYAV